MQTTLRKSQHNPGTPLVNIGTMVCFYVRYLLVCFYVRSTGINYVQLFSSSKYGLSAYFHFLSGYGFSFRLTPEHNLYYVNAICVNKTYVYMSTAVVSLATAILIIATETAKFDINRNNKLTPAKVKRGSISEI